MALLELHNVSKHYGGVQAVRDVSFSVAQGEMVGLMGANGAGKSSLFALIAGEVRADAGALRFDGRSLRGMRPDQICRLGIGRAFQIVKPFSGMSVLDSLITAAYFGAGQFKRHAPAAAYCREIAQECGLGSLLYHPAGTLTLSAQKRLELARALATGARLLMIDEVMAGLTPTEVNAMIATLCGLHERRGLTVLIIEHVMQALMQLAQRIVVLHHGERIAEGAPSVIAQDARVLEVYFGATP